MPDATSIFLNKCSEFVLKNRRDKAFKDWSQKDIELSIIEAVLNDTFAHIKFSDGTIAGILIARRDLSRKILHVINVLTIDRKALPLMLQTFKKLYTDDWKITGNRNGKLVTYTPTKLCRLLSKQA